MESRWEGESRLQCPGKCVASKRASVEQWHGGGDGGESIKRFLRKKSVFEMEWML